MRVFVRLLGFGVLTLFIASLAFRASGSAGSGVLYVSSTSGGSVSGVAFADEDVLSLDTTTGLWSMHMDGSDLGISPSRKIDGFHVKNDGGVLFSLNAPTSLPGVGGVDDSDVVEFTPTSVGADTSGTLSLYFDGSAYSLTSSDEDVDAVGLDAAGNLLLSTLGTASVGFGAAADEDIMMFDGTALSLFLDGSAVDLRSSSEDVVGVSVDSAGVVRLTVQGSYNVPDASGDRSDIAVCDPTSSGPIVSCNWSTFWDGSANGFQNETLSGLTAIGADNPPPPTTTTTTTAPTTTSTEPPTLGIADRAIYATSASGGSINGSNFADEDILWFDTVTGDWSVYVDGSDLGLAGTQKIDGFHVRTDGSVLFSLVAPAALPGLGTVDDSDVIEFTPSSVGPATSGSLSLYFDGSAHALTTSAEDVDAVSLDPSGNLLISTLGTASVGFGSAADEDVMVFDGSSLAMFLDGSTLGLLASVEDVVGLSVDPTGIIYLTTLGNYSVAGATGTKSDLLQCIPLDAAPITSCDFSTHWRGADHSFQGENVSGVTTSGAVTYFSDFSQGLGAEWTVYNSIGHAGWGLRRPSAVEVMPDPTAAGGDLLTITAKMGSGAEAGQLVSGGLKLRKPQIYGRYTIKVKADPDPDQVTSMAALLWPESNQWPRDGEIDIIETYASRATRTPVESNLHWLNPAATEPYVRSDDAKAQYVHPGISGAAWHTYTLEWREDLVSISIDGDTPLILSTNPAEIADWNMEPTLQLDAFDAPYAPGVQPSVSAPLTMYIDFILVQP